MFYVYILKNSNNKEIYPAPAFQKKSGAGFTLIEVLAAMFVMVVGALGAFSLITQTVTFNSSVHSQLVASYLAQEGLEIVRNMRDSNFLKIHKGAGGQWNEGLSACAAGCEADYNDVVLGSFQDTFLLLNNGLYAYDAGADTIFKRKITIDSSIDDILKVSVDVSWQDKGNTRIVRGAAELYNWLNPTP